MVIRTGDDDIAWGNKHAESTEVKDLKRQLAERDVEIANRVLQLHDRDDLIADLRADLAAAMADNEILKAGLVGSYWGSGYTAGKKATCLDLRTQIADLKRQLDETLADNERLRFHHTAIVAQADSGQTTVNLLKAESVAALAQGGDGARFMTGQVEMGDPPTAYVATKDCQAHARGRREGLEEAARVAQWRPYSDGEQVARAIRALATDTPAIETALDMIPERDAEIERLRNERDKANTRRDAEIYRLGAWESLLHTAADKLSVDREGLTMVGVLDYIVIACEEARQERDAEKARADKAEARAEATSQRTIPNDEE